MAALIRFQCAELDGVVRTNRALPIEPDLPTLGHSVRQLDRQKAGAFPMASPPRGGVQAPHARLPPGAQVLGNGARNFLHQTSAGNRDPTTGFHKAGEVTQIEVVCPVIDKGIDRHDEIEKVGGERKRARIRADRENALVGAGIPDALKILRGVEPQIRCPHLGTKFAVQKD